MSPALNNSCLKKHRTLAVGAGAGLSLGAAMDQDNIGVYLALGALLGILIGWGIDMNNRRKSKV